VNKSVFSFFLLKRYFRKSENGFISHLDLLISRRLECHFRSLGVRRHYARWSIDRVNVTLNQ